MSIIDHSTKNFGEKSILYWVSWGSFIVLGLWWSARSLFQATHYNISQPLGMAHRAVETGLFAYTTPTHGLCATSSPYFPGVPLLAYVIELTTSHQVASALLPALGVLFAMGFVYLIARFAHVQFNIPLPYALIYVVGAASAMKSWGLVNAEFKPDTAVLFMAIVITPILTDFLYGQKGLVNLFKCLLALVAAGLLKQQAVAIFAGFSIFCLISAKVAGWKKTLSALAMILLSGILVLLIVFLIPNAFEHTISAVAHHGFWTLRHIFIDIIYQSFRSIWFIWAITFLGGFLVWENRANISPQLRCWICVCAPWGMMCFSSMAKVGGHESNLELFLAAMLPFWTLGLHDIFEKISRQKLIATALGFIFILHGAAGVALYTKRYQTRISDEKNVVAYLSKYSGSSALAPVTCEDFLDQAGIDILTDSLTVNYFYTSKYDLSPIQTAMNNGLYHVLLVEKGSPSKWGITAPNTLYSKDDDFTPPPSLSSFELWIRN